MDNINVNNKLNSMTKLNKLKYHFNYAKQVGDYDIQLAYLSKIKDYFAEEIYGEFGYDTCHKSEQEFIDFKLLVINEVCYG